MLKPSRVSPLACVGVGGHAPGETLNDSTAAKIFTGSGRAAYPNAIKLEAKRCCN